MPQLRCLCLKSVYFGSKSTDMFQKSMFNQHDLPVRLCAPKSHAKRCAFDECRVLRQSGSDLDHPDEARHAESARDSVADYSDTTDAADAAKEPPDATQTYGARPERDRMKCFRSVSSCAAVAPRRRNARNHLSTRSVHRLGVAAM